ncbi:MAG TPA: ammonium transporter, partial [Candidatus Sumerlaeota bacterium]|nr:ammonium transporter [Candidatus Sumerlaeota bacterium]
MAAAALGLVAGTAAAQPAAPAIDTGDTAWMLVSAALVLLMTPGLALFYGGLVRGKNVLGTMMQSLAAMALVGVLWVVCGYTIAFGSDLGHVVGAFDYLLLRGVGGDPLDGQSIPHLLFVAFQGMFAIITPALIGGAVAERMKFKAFLLFMLLWVLLVYAPLAHWVWGSGGWLLELGALDFAGGTVVHISSGFSALIACLMLGRRRGFPGEPILPHNLPLVILGAGLLWFGWFGFNAGSALAANGTAALAL